MKILHLSDLHIDLAHLRDQKIVLKALFADLRREISENGVFDLVFFTGDLIAKGAYSPENMATAKDEFIEPLLAATQIESSRFFMVPGNHDVNLQLQSRNLVLARKSLNADT